MLGMHGTQQGLHVRGAGHDRVLQSDETVTIGRDAAAGIRIEDDRVSRRHALLRRASTGWVLEDDGSRNGTFHDGQRVARLEISHETVVRLGDPQEGPLLELRPRSVDGAPPTSPGGAGRELGRPTQTYPTGALVRIGRAPANDIVLDDLLVSRSHAELRPLPAGGYELVDLGSHNGTFVNGSRVTRVHLQELDVISIGRRRFRLVGRLLEEYLDTGEVTFEATGLTVTAPGGAPLLDDVGFKLEERGFLAVVGPSGAGKSTLLNALIGFHPAEQGSVYYSGRDLYAHYDELRGRIGFVPQVDVLHTQLTVAQALTYAAELRFPPDVRQAERLRRVDEVMDELGLTERRDLAIHRLSGGQRKRTSVALELLTQPSLLFLDEPTSGLDPGYERSLMVLLRSLADRGRTVVVVTHSVESLWLCDRVLFLAPGGRMAYFGPAPQAPAYFGRDDLQEVFQDLSSSRGLDWKTRFRAHADFGRYVERREPERNGPAGLRDAPAPLRRRGWLRQFRTLTRRYARVLAGDRRTLALLILQAPALGLVLLAALPRGELAPPAVEEFRLISRASLVLLMVVMGVTWLGALNAAREVVKELAIFRRERATGVRTSAYVASKAVVLGALAVLQAIVFVTIALAGQGSLGDGAVSGWPLGELVLAAALTGLGGMALGLLISALAKKEDRAMTVLPVLIIIEMILAMGGVFPDVVDKPVLKQLSYGASSQWGFSAFASTADLNELQAVNNLAREFPTLKLQDVPQVLVRLPHARRGEARWDHDRRAWLGSMGALAAIVAVGLTATSLVLSRYEPGASR